MFAFKFLLVFAVIVISESAFLDSLTKCPINDGECQRKLYETVLQDISKSGIEELNIPPIDPIELKNVSISILDLFEITMVDGIATGVKNCIFNNIITEIEKGHASMVITCDIAIKGHYKAFSDSPLFKSMLGAEAIKGDGFAKVKLEKLKIKFDFDFDIERGDDGEIYLKCKQDKTQYVYDILGRALFYIDHLYVGGQDMSQFITNFLNENGKYVLKNFGGPFMEKAMEFFYIFTHRFFDVVPAKYYISDDLTPYLKS